MTPLGEWASPPMSAIVRLTNQPSDNYIAEMLIKGLGARVRRPRARRPRGGAVVARRGRAPFGIDADRSSTAPGLSRSDRTSPREVVAAARRAWTRPRPARRSTLAGRRRPQRHALQPHARHRGRRTAATPRPARCATSPTLAGYCNTTGGERVAFAFLMNRVYPCGARALQDRMVGALARYDAPLDLGADGAGARRAPAPRSGSGGGPSSSSVEQPRPRRARRRRAARPSRAWSPGEAPATT